jgi:UDP-glucose 4-epimerase
MKKIIITGGLGHIGSYLVKKILIKNQKLNIIIIDNLSSQRLFSLFNLKTNSNKISFYDFDITKKNISKIVQKSQMIIHLAAATDAEKSLGNEMEYLNNNLNGTKKVVEYAKKFKVPLIFPSSTSVYGKMQKNDILKEDDLKKLFPQSPYAKIKLKEEKVIKNNLKSTKYAIIRLGTIVGISDGMRFHTAVNKFCYQASMNKEITVWKSAYDQVRPYATVDDFCRLIIFFMKNPKLISREIYNLVSKNLSVKQILELIREKKKIRVKFINSKIMNQLSYKVSNEKIKKIGFRPKNKIKKEIIKTLNLFNVNNKIV